MFNTEKITERIDYLQNLTPQELLELKRKAHICAIEDCMKAKRLLAGFGIAEHQVVLTDPADVFDSYYNCDIETLHIELESLCAQANKHVQELHPVGESSPTIFRDLSEDEMDKED